MQLRGASLGEAPFFFAPTLCSRSLARDAKTILEGKARSDLSVPPFSSRLLANLNDEGLQGEERDLLTER